MLRFRRLTVVVLAAGLVSSCVAPGADVVEERDPVWHSEKLGDDGALTSELAKGSIVAIGGKLYTMDGDELYVLDDTKSPKSWKFEELTTGHDWHLVGDEVIVGLSGSVTTVDAFTVYGTNGRERFQYPAEDVSSDDLRVEAVTVTGDTAVVAVTELETDENGSTDTTRALIGVSLGSGEELWSRPVEFDPVDISMAAPAQVDDVGLFAPVGGRFGSAVQPLGEAPVVYLSPDYDDEAVAIDVETGEERWQLSGPVKQLATAGVTMAGDFIVSADPDDAVDVIAEVEVADTRDGSTEVFTTRMEDAGAPRAVLSVCDGRLLGAELDGRASLIDLEDREPVWTAEKKGNPLSCIDSTVIYVTGGEDHSPIGEVAIGDEHKWDFGSPDPNKSFAPVYLDEKLVIGSGFETTIARDRATGKVRWEAEGSVYCVYATAGHYFVWNSDGLRAYDR